MAGAVFGGTAEHRAGITVEEWLLGEFSFEGPGRVLGLRSVRVVEVGREAECFLASSIQRTATSQFAWVSDPAGFRANVCSLRSGFGFASASILGTHVLPTNLILTTAGTENPVTPGAPRCVRLLSRLFDSRGLTHCLFALPVGGFQFLRPAERQTTQSAVPPDARQSVDATADRTCVSEPDSRDGQ